MGISATCPDCVPFIHSPNLGVNPRGLLPRDVWQMDVTHVASLGKLSFVHVSVDTYSGLLFASAHSGEKARDVKNHYLAAFAYAGVPPVIKTNNGSAYSSKNFKDCFFFLISIIFLIRWVSPTILKDKPLLNAAMLR